MRIGGPGAVAPGRPRSPQTLRLDRFRRLGKIAGKVFALGYSQFEALQLVAEATNSGGVSKARIAEALGMHPPRALAQLNMAATPLRAGSVVREGEHYKLAEHIKYETGDITGSGVNRWLFTKVAHFHDLRQKKTKTGVVAGLADVLQRRDAYLQGGEHAARVKRLLDPTSITAARGTADRAIGTYVSGALPTRAEVADIAGEAVAAVAALVRDDPFLSLVYHEEELGTLGQTIDEELRDSLVHHKFWNDWDGTPKPDAPIEHPRVRPRQDLLTYAVARALELGALAILGELDHQRPPERRARQRRRN
jgi:hypothetical protein